MTPAVQVCVLGAGPAGCAVAARLARLGHQVLLLDAAPALTPARRSRLAESPAPDPRPRLAESPASDPRSRLGESLGPGIWPLLDALDLREPVAAGAVLHAPVASVRWRQDTEDRGPLAGGLTVDRAAFDALLAQRAQAAGARLVRSARAGRPRRTAEGWIIPLADREQPARFLVDASGRRRVSGGPRTRPAPPLLAVHAIFRPDRPAQRPRTWVDTGPDGWAWGADLPGGRIRTIAFLDPDAAGPDRAALLRRLLAGMPLATDRLAGARLVGPVRACDASSYAATTLVEPAGIKVGEAGFAIDPLSAGGVQVALQSGLAAAAVVHTLLDPAGQHAAALRYYRDLVEHTLARNTATAAALYAEPTRFADRPFWRRRRPAAPDPVSSRGPVAATTGPAANPDPAAIVDYGLPAGPAVAWPPVAGAAARVRLAPGATVVDTPCLIGDRIELRGALTHPALDRPVAFVGDAELAPLLAGLQRPIPLTDALRAWDATLPAGRAAAVASWLHRTGVIELG